MKKLICIFLVISFAFLLASCDYGKDDLKYYRDNYGIELPEKYKLVRKDSLSAIDGGMYIRVYKVDKNWELQYDEKYDNSSNDNYIDRRLVNSMNDVFHMKIPFPGDYADVETFFHSDYYDRAYRDHILIYDRLLNTVYSVYRIH